MKHQYIYILLLTLFISPIFSVAQSDTLVTKDRNILNGEIKQMEKEFSPLKPAIVKMILKLNG